MQSTAPPLAGSDGSAAGGGYSDLSEWPRSADDAAAPSARKMPGTATGQGNGFFAALRMTAVIGSLVR